MATSQFFRDDPEYTADVMLVAGLSCMIAGIVKMVQCGLQDDGNSENALVLMFVAGLSCIIAGIVKLAQELNRRLLNPFTGN